MHEGKKFPLLDQLGTDLRTLISSQNEELTNALRAFIDTTDDLRVKAYIEDKKDKGNREKAFVESQKFGIRTGIAHDIKHLALVWPDCQCYLQEPAITDAEVIQELLGRYKSIRRNLTDPKNRLCVSAEELAPFVKGTDKVITCCEVALTNAGGPKLTRGLKIINDMQLEKALHECTQMIRADKAINPEGDPEGAHSPYESKSWVLLNDHIRPLAQQFAQLPNLIGLSPQDAKGSILRIRRELFDKGWVNGLIDQDKNHLTPVFAVMDEAIAFCDQMLKQQQQAPRSHRRM